MTRSAPSSPCRPPCSLRSLTRMIVLVAAWEDLVAACRDIDHRRYPSERIAFLRDTLIGLGEYRKQGRRYFSPISTAVQVLVGNQASVRQAQAMVGDPVDEERYDHARPRCGAAPHLCRPLARAPTRRDRRHPVLRRGAQRRLRRRTPPHQRQGQATHPIQKRRHPRRPAVGRGLRHHRRIRQKAGTASTHDHDLGHRHGPTGRHPRDRSTRRAPPANPQTDAGRRPSELLPSHSLAQELDWAQRDCYRVVSQPTRSESEVPVSAFLICSKLFRGPSRRTPLEHPARWIRGNRIWRVTSKMPHIAYLVVQQNISSSAVGPTISRSIGFQALPTSFGVVRSAPKRSLADSSDESVPTEIHRSFRREPVVVHARRSPSNGRRGAAGSWLVSEPAGQVGGRARRHSLWTSQPSTTSTNAMIPVG